MGTTLYSQAVAAGGLTVARLVEQVFPPSYWATMVAIADAESTFNPRVVNAATGAAGLFQIEALPGRPSAAALLDPLTNVQTAWALVQRHGLAPWTGDGYPAYLGVAQQLVQATAISTVSVRVSQASGRVQVGPDGIITAQLTLTALGGGVSYRVATQLLAGATPVQFLAPNPASGELAAGQTAIVTQTAQLAAAPQIRAATGQQVTVAYTVRWTVTDRVSGSQATVETAPGAVTLVV